jgi:hypothetical protein
MKYIVSFVLAFSLNIFCGTAEATRPSSEKKIWTISELSIAYDRCLDPVMKQMMVGIAKKPLPISHWRGQSDLPYIPTYDEFERNPKAYYHVGRSLYRMFQNLGPTYNLRCNGYFGGDAWISTGDDNGLTCPLRQPGLANELRFEGFERGWIEAQTVFYDIVKDSYGNIIEAKQGFVSPRAVKPSRWTPDVRLISKSGVVTDIHLDLAAHQACLERAIR